MNATARGPTELHDRFAEFLGRGDMDGLLSLFADDAILRMGADAEAVQGREAIAAQISGLVQARPTLDSTVETLLVNGDIALMRGRWTAHGPDGPLAGGESVEVAVRHDDGWRWLIDCPMG